MLASPFTFLRGAAGLMARDLAATTATGVQVEACGDCHLLNFGRFGSAERQLIFDINDSTLFRRRSSSATSRSAGRCLHARTPSRAMPRRWAVATFAVAYTDQTERDHRALERAVRSGRLTAVDENR